MGQASLNMKSTLRKSLRIKLKNEKEKGKEKKIYNNGNYILYHSSPHTNY